MKTPSVLLSFSLLLLLSLSVSLFVGCQDDPPPEETTQEAVLSLEILSVEALAPSIEGGLLVLEVRGLDPDAQGQRKLKLSDPNSDALVILDEFASLENGAVSFILSATALQAFGDGSLALNLSLTEGTRQSPELLASFTFAQTLPVTLERGLDEITFLEGALILHGDGFLDVEEGLIIATITGDFTPEKGEPEPVSARLPISLADKTSRGRGLLRLTTDLSGLAVGTFEGTITLQSTLRSGVQSDSTSQPLKLSISPSQVFSYTPESPHLGQFVTLRGGGFIGAPDRVGESTLLRFEGDLILADGTTRRFGPEEIAVRWISGQEVQLGLDVMALDGRLVSSFLGIRVGSFEGEVTPISLKGIDDLQGTPSQVKINIAGVRQVVHVEFLPGFYSSLEHFGLSAASEEVVAQTLARMESIYEGYSIQFVTTPPADALPSAITLLEIGGSDPNQLGMFGYDNTPGKDVGNLRLFDHIGGANAATQADGYPGYGGVFIESILFWSSHPELSGDLPVGAPDPEPLFDEIFDPVRKQAASLAETRGAGDSGRVVEVARAVQALGNLIGETTAHELGHSLGLAQPYGSSTAFHSFAPGEGCLMDTGSQRPFGERAAQEGFPTTHFCDDAPDYLDEILGSQK